MIIDKLRNQIKEFKTSGFEPTLIVLKPETEREMFLDGSFKKSEVFNETITIDEKEYRLIIAEFEGVFTDKVQQQISYLKTIYNNEYLFLGDNPQKNVKGFNLIERYYFLNSICNRTRIKVLRPATPEEIELFNKGK